VYGPAGHARHVAALIERLDLEPVCVLGHSFGAEVAARLAAARPDLVRAAVFAGPTSDPAARTRRHQIGRWLVDLIREDPRQAGILARDVRNAGPRRIWHTLGASVRNRIENDLAAATAPALFLGGARDPIVPARWLAEAARIYRGAAETVEIPGAGHNVATTAGAAVADHVTRFLARTRSARRLRP
jgi:pimeloyl-ACP methyl ester carboxylesterase